MQRYQNQLRLAKLLRQASAWAICSGRIRQPAACGLQEAAIPVIGHAADRLPLLSSRLIFSNAMQPLDTPREEVGNTSGTALKCHLLGDVARMEQAGAGCCHPSTAFKDLHKPATLLPQPPPLLLQEFPSVAYCLMHVTDLRHRAHAAC